MASLYDLGVTKLAIPAWQIALYIGVVSFFMISRKTKYCLLTTYLSALYCGYYLFGRELLNAARGNGALETAYISFGLGLVALCLMALFYDEP